MLDILKKILLPTAGEREKGTINTEKKLQIATCALFIEMAKADNEFSEEERENIIAFMKKTFDLDEEYVQELVELSEEKVNQSISIYEFSSVINDNFSNDEKYELMKNLWRLIYLDDNLHAHEDSLIRKINATLNLDHHVMIAAKMQVKEELKK